MMGVVTDRRGVTLSHAEPAPPLAPGGLGSAWERRMNYCLAPDEKQIFTSTVPI
jgi:hypothetical protein